jgi:hypothetical protein
VSLIDTQNPVAVGLRDKVEAILAKQLPVETTKVALMALARQYGGAIFHETSELVEFSYPDWALCEDARKFREAFRLLRDNPQFASRAVETPRRQPLPRATYNQETSAPQAPPEREAGCMPSESKSQQEVLPAAPTVEQSREEAAIREAARLIYEEEGQIEIDSNAPIGDARSEGGDDGVYVQAWVWVPSYAISVPEEGAEKETPSAPAEQVVLIGPPVACPRCSSWAELLETGKTFTKKKCSNTYCEYTFIVV